MTEIALQPRPVRVSATGRNFIEKWEELRLEPYRDLVGVWTIGFGHTGDDVLKLGRISASMATLILIKDLEPIERAIDNLVSDLITLTQSQFDALASFTFNLGIRALTMSTLLKNINENRMTSAAVEFLRWDMAGSHVVVGLENRRKAEAAMFASSLPTT